MKVLDKIRSFLSNTNDISLGYREINFIQPDNLDDEQIGYSIDPNGNSLITGNDRDWQEEWLVIATNDLGDPLFVDVSSPNFTVLSAQHGEGNWEPFVIAEGLDNLKDIISLLEKLSVKRTNPVEFEKLPITDKERRNFLTQIREQNPGAEISFWENFVENE